MSEFLVKGNHFVTKHVWFVNEVTKNIEGEHDRLLIHGYPIEKGEIGKYKCKSVPQETLISDLTLDEDVLWGLTSKTVRNEINRSIRENFEAVIYRGEDVTNDLLDSFDKMYHDMYEEKGMSGYHLPIGELKTYAENDALIITTAEIDGTTVIYHSYITDQGHARLLHSCSEFRVADNAMRNAIGRANKFLHWKDWLYLKDKGITEYDWGGISSYDSPNGIDKFKMSFGGQHKKYYNLFADCSFMAKVHTGLQKIIRG